MYLLIVLLLHKLGHYIFTVIVKESRKILRLQYSGKRLFFEMSGTLMNFLVALIIFLGIALTNTKRELPIENAIYGIEWSELAKSTGFKEGDKLVKINREPIVFFSEIRTKLLFETTVNSEIEVLRNNEIVTFYILESIFEKGIEAGDLVLARPILTSDSGIIITIDDLNFVELPVPFGQSVKSFSHMLGGLFNIILPNNGYGTGSFMGVGQVVSIRHGLLLMALLSTFLGILNLIPVPGFDLGNCLLAIIERKRGPFNQRTMKMLRIGGIMVFIAYLIVLLVFF